MNDVLFSIESLTLYVSFAVMGYFAHWFHRNRHSSLSGFQAFLLSGITTMLLLAQAASELEPTGYWRVRSGSVLRSVQVLCLFWVVVSLHSFHRLGDVVVKSRLFRTLTDGIFVVDPETGSIQDVNPTGLDQLGVSGKRLGGTRFQDLARGLPGGSWSGFVRRLRSRGTILTSEGQLTPLGGSPFPVEARSRYIEEENNILVVTRDITRRKRIRKQLRRNETHDELTGLPNRKYFRSCLQDLLDRTEPSDQSGLWMGVFDLNRFKDVNDAHGHHAGDRVLQVVANRLLTLLDSRYTVARLGTDEFALLGENESTADPGAIAERALRSIQQPIRVESNELRVQARAGLVVGKGDYERAGRMIRDANLALRKAKKGRSRSYAQFSPEMRRSRQSYLDQKQELVAAFREDQFELRYQPILDIETNRLVGVEALTRWRHPSKGLLSPSDFLSTVRKTEMLHRLDSHALREACRQGKRWHEMVSGDPRLTISVNFSPTNFLHDHVTEHITETIQAQGFQPEYLHLELLETDVMHRSELNPFSLAKLKNSGIKLLLDDFGTGYSSLEHLHRLPVDTLKIDRGFVSNIETDRVAFDLVKTIVNLATDLGKNVIAEGIETERQRTLLREMGCRHGQGYYLSKPLVAEDVEAMIESTRSPSLTPEGIAAASTPIRGSLSRLDTGRGREETVLLPVTNS